MQNILKQLNAKPIAYYPIYRQITGSTTAGILLSQLMYWFNKKDKIFKTDREIMEETLLSEKELRNAKKLIKNLDFITVSREGLPAKTYYEIDWEKFENCLKNDDKSEQTSNDQRADTVPPKGQDCTSQKGETYIVKSLTETTTEITTEIKNTKKGFDNFIKLLKTKAPIKSKVTRTDKGFEFYKTIENKEQLMQDYIAHQYEKVEFAKRITAFMEDYNSMPNQTNSSQQTMQVAGEWAFKNTRKECEIC